VTAVGSPNGVVRRADITLDLARALLDGVTAEAATRGVAMGAAVVDRAGNLVAAVRMDGAQIVAVPLAVDKAWTAVACGRPTEAWTAATQPGGSDWGFNTTLGGRVVVFPGGVPVVVDGEVVGGLGVSGAPPAVDKACAEAGLAAAGLAPAG
jgi:uncharacterized protein GlcG (DUF336 family)